MGVSSASSEGKPARGVRDSARAALQWLFERSSHAIGFAAVVATCVFVGQLHAFFWKHAGQYGADDGYTMAMGERLIGGHWLPYVDGCSHRGPLLYWMAALSQEATGRFGWKGARVLSIATTYGTLLGIFAVGLAGRRPLGGAIGSIFYCWSVLVGLGASPAYAITGEGLASPLAMASLFFATLALLRVGRADRRLGLLAIAGAFAGLAGLAKQTALPIIAPLALWSLVAPALGGAPRRERIARLGAMLAGFVGPLLLVVGLYAAKGELHTLWYWYYAYNAHVYMAPYKGASFVGAFEGFIRGEPWSVGVFAAFALRGVLSPVLSRGAHTRLPRGSELPAAAGLECTAGAVAIVFFASAVAPMRFWTHYFLPVFPFVALLIGIRVEEAFPRRVASVATVLSALALLTLASVFLWHAVDVALLQYEADARHGGWPAETHEAICDVIDANSRPGDSLFVWGFSGDFYLTCRRRPATRYVYLTLVAGTVPPNWSDVRASRVAENARENLVSDLKKERPPVVLDVPESMGNVSFRDVPIVREYIKEQYCMRDRQGVRHGGHATVWVRKDLPGCHNRAP